MLSENKLTKEIKLLKEQRKELEQTRQELLKKGRELLALNRHRRNQGIKSSTIKNVLKCKYVPSRSCQSMSVRLHLGFALRLC